MSAVDSVATTIVLKSGSNHLLVSLGRQTPTMLVEAWLLGTNENGEQRADGVAGRVGPAHSTETNSGDQHGRNQRTKERGQTGGEVVRGDSGALMLRSKLRKDRTHRYEGGNA